MEDLIRGCSERREPPPPCELRRSSECAEARSCCATFEAVEGGEAGERGEPVSVLLCAVVGDGWPVPAEAGVCAKDPERMEESWSGAEELILTADQNYGARAQLCERTAR